MRKILLNDQFVHEDHVKINHEDRGYQFGDGIYEVIGVYDGKPFRMKEHLRRLGRSASEIALKIDKIKAGIEEQLEQLININQLKSGIVYVQVSRGAAPRIHHFPQDETPPTFIAYTTEMEHPVDIQKNGVACFIVDDIRWLRCDIKTLNLLGNVLARQQAVERHCYEAIFQRGETITEGAGTNLFIVKDGMIYTHPVNHFILNGITRGAVLDICKAEGIAVYEETFGREQLLGADEVFLTGTYIDVVPVTEINERTIGGGQPGKITRRLQKELSKRIKESQKN